MVPSGNMLPSNNLPMGLVPTVTVTVAIGTARSLAAFMNQRNDITSRLGPGACRDSRSESFATRFTRNELAILTQAAARDGMKVREWAREILLRESRRSE